MHLRQATSQDLDAVYGIILDGKAALAQLGIDQWQGGSPTREMIQEDIVSGWCYVAEHEGTLLATMAYVTSGEADYDRVISGSWVLDLDNVPEDGKADYAVVHRVAASAQARGTGAGRFLLTQACRMAQEQGLKSVRVDTHEGNVVMRNLLPKCGYAECCEIDITAPLEPTKKRIGFERVIGDGLPDGQPQESLLDGQSKGELSAGQPWGGEPVCEDGLSTCEVESWNLTRETDLKYMSRALELAKQAADQGEVPIGAVVVCQGQVVAEGFNLRETLQDPSAHAEFHAMVAAAKELERWRLTGCTVYVTVEPCIMCAGLMHQARIDRCVYGAPDAKAGALGTLYSVHADARLNHTFQVTAGVMEEECAQVIKDFFARKRAEKGMPGRKLP